MMNVQILRRCDEPQPPASDSSLASSSCVCDSSAPSSLSDRLKTIRARLNYLGANSEFCEKYFENSSGTCDEFRCQTCVKHSFGVAPLPPGLMCRNAFEKHLGQIRGKISVLSTDITGHRHMWNQLRLEETASGFLGGVESSAPCDASGGVHTKVRPIAVGGACGILPPCDRQCSRSVATSSRTSCGTSMV